MHPEVIEEVREKTPTPVFKPRIVDGEHGSRGSIFLNFLKTSGGAGVSA